MAPGPKAKHATSKPAPPPRPLGPLHRLAVRLMQTIERLFVLVFGTMLFILFGLAFFVGQFS